MKLYRRASRIDRSAQQQSALLEGRPSRRVGICRRTGSPRSALASVVTAAVLSLGGLTARAQLPSDDFFPIGVHSQPRNSFDKWKARGINTLFQYEAERNGQGVPLVSIRTWSDLAASKGLYYVREPSANPADDLQEPNLLAWAQKDEPDLINHDPNPAVNIDIYQNWKAIGPSKPVWINFAGPGITTAGADYRQWVKGGDWVASDWYPINWNRLNNINFTGQAIDKLRKDANGVPKKYMAYIESSWQKLNVGTRGPTPDEFRGSVWHAIMHGAGGIIYFPQVVPNVTVGGGFSYDGTPADVAAEMTRVNAQVQSYARILNDDQNPASRSLTSSNTAIEATWRVVERGDFYFVLNQSRNPISNVPLSILGLPAGITALNVVGENRTELLVGGTIIDDFTPWQVHVYTTAALTAAEVPEPASAGLLAAAVTAWALRRPGSKGRVKTQ
jgi:hypothetical protein